MKRFLIFGIILFMLMGCVKETETIPPQDEIVEEIAPLNLDDPIAIDETILELYDGQRNILNEKFEADDIYKISVPQILSDKAEAKSFNEQMNKLYEEANQKTVYEEEGTLFTAHFVWNEIYLNEDVTSILIHQQSMQWGAGMANETIDAYNYDYSNGHFLTNEELLGKFNFEISSLEEKLNKYLNENFSKCLDTPIDQPCILLENANKTSDENIFYSISNNDKVYIKDGNVHIILSGRLQISSEDFDITIN